MKYTVNGLEELNKVATEIADSIEEKVILFYGEMGAGKTTTIKAICKALGVLEEVSSPTFSLVNEYMTSSGETVFHFDMYRINSEEEVYDMGYEEYFYSGNICLVEWPEKIPTLLPEKYGEIKISVSNKIRTIDFVSSV